MQRLEILSFNISRANFRLLQPSKSKTGYGKIQIDLEKLKQG